MSKTDSIFKRLERLKHIGEQLAFKELSLKDKKFLSDALIRIGEEETSSEQLEQTAQQEADELEQRILGRHPDLTLESLRRMMELSGY